MVGKYTLILFVRASLIAYTGFYICISLVKEQGYYGLRDDINQITNVCADYKPNEEIEIEFSFDEHAFVVKKGENYGLTYRRRRFLGM